MLGAMGHKTWAALEPEQRTQVIDDVYERLAPIIEKGVNDFVKSIEPQMRQIVRDEIGKWAVSEKQAVAFLDGMVLEAAKKIMATFQPRWFARFFFRRGN